MVSLSEYLVEKMNENTNTVVKESENTIKSEKDFREAARAKFEEVFGDELDENQMKETIDGLLEDNKDLVEKGDWGELIGMLNKSFSSSEKEK